MDKLVSIIIPVFNGAKSISCTLDSVIIQSYQNLEIIVVDDGSTDNTFEILKTYEKKDSRIKAISQLNAGPGAARNYGLSQATGDFITFVDADDLIDNEIIEKLVETIQRENVDVVRYNFYYSTRNNLNEKIGSLYHLSNQMFMGNEIRDKIIPIFIKNELCSYTPLLFMKKEIASKIKFDTNTIYMEDTIFYIDLLYQIQSIYFLDVAGYYYFYTPQSEQTSTEFIRKYLQSLNYVYKTLKNIVKLNEKEYEKKVNCLNLKWLNTIIDYITILERVDDRIKFKEWKKVINELEFNKSCEYNALNIKFYNKISIWLLTHNYLKTLFIFTKTRNLIGKIIR